VKLWPRVWRLVFLTHVVVSVRHTASGDRRANQNVQIFRPLAGIRLVAIALSIDVKAEDDAVNWLNSVATTALTK